jgi:hypothetical protein
VQDPREVGSDLPLQALGRRDVWLVERPVKDGEVVEQPAIPPRCSRVLFMSARRMNPSTTTAARLLHLGRGIPSPAAADCGEARSASLPYDADPGPKMRSGDSLNPE